MIELPDRPFLASEIEDLGLTRRLVRTLVRDGVLLKPFLGVYCAASLPDTIELRAACAKLLLPENSVVCDRSAAWIHGVDAYSWTERALPPRLELVAICGRDRTRRKGMLGGKRDLIPEDICEINGVLVTTPLRTACDLACLRGRRFALAILDAFMRCHDLSHDDFQRMIRRFYRRRGVTQLRELAPLASPLSESHAEAWTRMDIIDAGLPPPQLQIWVDVPGFGSVRLDLAYERLRIAVEYDGEEHHSSETDRARDAARRAALERLGWIVIVVRKEDLAPGSDGQWLTDLRQALHDRTPPPRRKHARGESAWRTRRTW